MPAPFWTKAEVTAKKLDGSDGFDHPQWVEDVGEAVMPGQWTKGTAGEVVATVDDPTKTPFTIEAFTGQSGMLWVVKDENGDIVATLDPTGALIQTQRVATGELIYQLVTAELAADGIDVYQIFSLDKNTPLLNLDSAGGIESFLCSDDAQWFIKAGPGNSGVNIGVRITVPIQVAPTGGSLSLLYNLAGFELIENAGRGISVGPDGSFVLRAQTTAPAGAGLNPGDHTFYIDPTPGAVKLMVEAKDTGGALVSAVVASLT